jgi:pentatricopeptide repeat protein
MNSKAIQPNHVTYTCLVDGLCNVGKWEEAQSLMEKMTQENILPNVQTCSIMLNSMFKEGRLEDVKILFDEIDSKRRQTQSFTIL